MQSSPGSRHFLPLRYKYSRQQLVPKHNLCSSLCVKSDLNKLQAVITAISKSRRLCNVQPSVYVSFYCERPSVTPIQYSR
jgi:hypothetical protein